MTVVSLDARREAAAAVPQSDDARLTAALGDAWELARALERRVGRLETENAQLVADRDKWAMEWAALQQLFQQAASGDTTLSKRHCCFCGHPYLGSAAACPSHIYLLLLEHRSERAAREERDLVDDLLAPARYRRQAPAG